MRSLLASLALSLQKEGKALTVEQSADLQAWNGELQRAAISPEQMKKEIAETRGSYATFFKKNAKEVKMLHTLVFHDAFFWDLLSCMLIGMALYKWGVFQGRLSKKWYALMACVGYAAGLSINFYEINIIEQGDFSLMAYLQAEQTYHLGRIFTTMGHIGLVLLVVKFSWLPFLQRALAAVGRMALTNYISHSILSLFLFSGVGLGLFGQLERYQLYYIVFAIWLVQLVTSPIWLHYFYFGPLEWVWRSLTYNKIQPFKRIHDKNDLELKEGQMPEYTLTSRI